MTDLDIDHTSVRNAFTNMMKTWLRGDKHAITWERVIVVGTSSFSFTVVGLCLTCKIFKLCCNH